jgi:mRNA interferase MazF
LPPRCGASPDVRRGELYWAHLPDPIGRRPVLIVTRTGVLGVRASVTVAPITRTVRQIPSEVALDRAHGLRAASVANCDSLQTIPKASLGPRPLGRLAVPELPALDRALSYALGIRRAST